MITIWNSTLIVLTCLYGVGVLFFIIGLFFPDRVRQKRQPLVSVVIAARNEEQNLPHCLSDLVNQTYPTDLYEVIVVDDASRDNTAGIVTQFSQKYPQVKLVSVDSVTSGYTPKKNAINKGIENSKGEIILTTDADCRVKPTWIETMASYFTPEVGMVVGFSQMGLKHEKGSLFEKLQAVDFFALMAAAAGSTNLGFPLAASGQNLAYRRQAFDDVGGFSSISHRVSGDDLLLLQLINKRTHWKIRFAASDGAYNATKPEKSIRAFLNQRKRWASNGSYQFHLNKIFFLYILLVFLFNFSLLVGLPTGLFCREILPTLGYCFLVKISLEFLLILKGASVFSRSDLIPYFPLWVLLQIPYVVVAGLLGTFGQFTWKGRKHNQMARN